jgi:hypothetical protein
MKPKAAEGPNEIKRFDRRGRDQANDETKGRHASTPVWASRFARRYEAGSKCSRIPLHGHLRRVNGRSLAVLRLAPFPCSCDLGDEDRWIDSGFRVFCVFRGQLAVRYFIGDFEAQPPLISRSRAGRSRELLQGPNQKSFENPTAKRTPHFHAHDRPTTRSPLFLYQPA